MSYARLGTDATATLALALVMAVSAAVLVVAVVLLACVGVAAVGRSNKVQSATPPGRELASLA